MAQPNLSLEEVPWFPNEGVRAQKKRLTKVAIRQAALELFTERGFAATTVEDIAAHAKISARTFFNYYESKEQCVVFPHDDLAPILRASLLKRPRDEAPLVSFCEAVKSMFVGFESSPVIREQIIRGAKLQRVEPALVAADGSFRRVWEETAATAFVERGVNRRLARIIGVVAVGTWKVAMQEWAIAGSEGSMVEAIDDGFEQLKHALGR
jgi:AcrR family transcriptional regulator